MGIARRTANEEAGMNRTAAGIRGLVGAVALAMSLAGCGGGAPGTAPTGGAVFNVVWPARSRLIPIASNSITVVISQNGTPVASQTLTRPATTITFNELAPATYLATATAFPSLNGTGVGQATGAVPLTINPSQLTSVTLTMASTIDHLDIAPLNPSTVIGQTVQFTVTARDITNAVVLTLPATIQWQSGNTVVATINPNGLATGLKGGTSVITVTETESVKSANTTLTVTNGGGVIIVN